MNARYWVDVDERYGHVTIRDRETHYAIAHIFDTGGTCAIDVHEPLTPQRAEDLGGELIRWAIRKKAAAREAARVTQGLPPGTITKEDT